MSDANDKIKALAQYLGIPATDVVPSQHGGDNDFEADGGEYTVLTDEEADEAMLEHCKQNAWAFRAKFIVQHSGLPAAAEEMVREFCADKCEDANDTIVAMIDDIDEFAKDAAQADGRGHFLAGYDSDEGTQGGFYIYCQNKNYCGGSSSKATLPPGVDAEDREDDGHACEAVNLALFGPARLCCKTCGKDM